MYIPELHNQVEYTLSHYEYGTITVADPKGFEDDVPQIKKSKKNFSTVTTYSTELEFVLTGARWILAVYDKYGFDTDIILTKKQIHPTLSDIQEVYSIILDGYTLEHYKGKVKISGQESALSALINTYKGEKLELNNTQSLNGHDIGELKVDKCFIDGKGLLFISKWSRDEDNIVIRTDRFENPVFGDSDFHQLWAVPFNQILSGDVQDFSVSSFNMNRNINTGNGMLRDGTTSSCFYYLAERDNTTLNLTIDIDQEFKNLGSGISTTQIQLLLIRYEDKSATGGDQYTFLDVEPLATATGTKYDLELKYFAQIQRTLQKGQSFCIANYMYSSKSSSGTWKIDITTHKADLMSRQDSHVDGTHTKTVLPFEIFERFLRLMTGRTDFILESEYFGRKDLGYKKDGEGAYLGVASGFWARQFNDKPLVASWDDVMKSYGVVSNISYNIERKGFLEYVKIEPLETDFFSSKVIRLPNIVEDEKIKPAKDFSFSAIEIGYEKGGAEYEEAAGLDEPNGKHSYTTPISKSTTKLSLISKIRADMTGFEFARRKPQINYGTEDTRYDEHNFFLDMKKGDTEILLQRKKEDDYTDISGIYSPETATNLRLSPKQLLVKHGWFIKNCLTKYTDKEIRFASSTGNSEMILDGVQENDNFLINLLNKNKFINKEVEFSHKVSNSLYEEIQKNKYSIIEYINNKGKVNRFYLFKLNKNKFGGLLIE